METFASCRLIELPKIADARGNLTFIEGGRHLDYDIRRVYYLYDIPGGAERGGHAHREQQEFLVAIAGSFDVVVDDGREKSRIHLNRSYTGLHIPRLVWRELENFSSGSVCMVLSSGLFDESDYYRDYASFAAAVAQARGRRLRPVKAAA